MHKTLAEIAKIVDGKVVGDNDLVITGLSGIQEAREGDLTFLANPKYIPLSKKTKATAILTSRDVDIPGKPVIQTDNPSLAFADLMSVMADEESRHFQGIHPSAIIAKDCDLGKNVAVGPLAIIESGAKIGDNTVVYGSVYIGQKTVVGENCLIYPHVTLREKIRIGNRVIIQGGAVVGSDGFGYVQVNGEHKKIPQMGTVVIEDDVEIGANVTIDRARFSQTIIRRGCKLDNLSHVAHNVDMGEDCIIIAQTGISGSTKIGKGCYLLGQSGTAGHIDVGEGSIIYSQSSITRSCPPGSHILGSPGRDSKTVKKAMAASMKLPEYISIIKKLQKRIEKLEAKNNQ